VTGRVACERWQEVKLPGAHITYSCACAGIGCPDDPRVSEVARLWQSVKASIDKDELAVLGGYGLLAARAQHTEADDGSTL
jgi:hypothetical protein